MQTVKTNAPAVTLPKPGNAQIGAASELRAAAWLLEKGYNVFRNVAPTGMADLVAVNFATKQTLWIDVKSSLTARASDEQVEAGVRLLVVLDDWVGWPEEHPSKRLSGELLARVLADHKTHRTNRRQWKPGKNHPWKVQRTREIEAVKNCPPVTAPIPKPVVGDKV